MTHRPTRSTLFPYTTLFRSYITPSNFSVDANNTLSHGTLLNAKFWSENREFQQDSDFLHVGLGGSWQVTRSEEHTSELQSQFHLVCRLLLEKKKYNCKTNAE